MKPNAGREVILGLLSPPQPPLSLIEIERRLKVKAAGRRFLLEMMLELESEGIVRRVKGGRWTSTAKGSNIILGRLEVTGRGFGFVRPDATENAQGLVSADIFIAPEQMGAALDGDLVRAEVIRFDDRGPAGRIREVVEHRHSRIVGMYQSAARGGMVIPRNRRIDRRIAVPKPDPKLKIKEFDWVWVELTDYPPTPEPLRGKVVERLGTDDDRGIDILVLLRDRGIVEEFSDVTMREVADMKVDWPAEIARRHDLRNNKTITIDPLTAKDFDDALSIEPLGKGWRLQVHIADVAHFVREGTSLDRDARERSTSVYPVDRVVPMLPEKLSADLCSLRPREDRLTVTAEIDFDHDGIPIASRSFESIIHSNHRMTYEEVQALFDKADPNLAGRVADVKEMLGQLRTLAKKLRAARFKRGALDLDIPSVDVIFDAAGKVCDLRFHPNSESHQLIEECMIAANEAVAREVTARGGAMVYRIHEPVDEDRLEKLIPVLKIFGIRLVSGKGGITPLSIQAALKQAEQINGGHIIRRLILRALKRAEYSPRNPGHFGLASKCYCHFTSPIRRYADLVVHRQVKAYATKSELPYGDKEGGAAELGEMTNHMSIVEREAQEAEWEAIKIKSLEFMKRFEGEEFDGIICGVQNFGLFVELEPYPVEGLVPARDIPGDRYSIDESGVRLVGARSGAEFKLGQPVRVAITRVAPLEQQMDLRLITPGGKFPTRKRRK